jgi:hypothetical protein
MTEDVQKADDAKKEIESAITALRVHRNEISLKQFANIVANTPIAIIVAVLSVPVLALPGAFAAGAKWNSPQPPAIVSTPTRIRPTGQENYQATFALYDRRSWALAIANYLDRSAPALPVVQGQKRVVLTLETQDRQDAASETSLRLSLPVAGTLEAVLAFQVTPARALVPLPAKLASSAANIPVPNADIGSRLLVFVGMLVPETMSEVAVKSLVKMEYE